MEVVLEIIGYILGAVGVTLIYSARTFAKKWFSFSDQNEGCRWLKIVGFVLSIIGAILLFCYLR